MNHDRNSDEHPLRLVGITYNQIESGVYALVLEEINGKRRIPIVIGFPEAQAIECKLQEVVSPRPLTHDLIVGMLKAMDAFLEKVVIRRLPSGVFAAFLHIRCKDGREIRLDSRSSDAIAVAIRTNAPIFTSSKVLEEAGFLPNEERIIQRRDEIQGLNDPLMDLSDTIEPEADESLHGLGKDELLQRLNKEVERENYEKAAEIKKILDEMDSES